MIVLYLEILEIFKLCYHCLTYGTGTGQNIFLENGMLRMFFSVKKNKKREKNPNLYYVRFRFDGILLLYLGKIILKVIFVCILRYKLGGNKF